MTLMMRYRQLPYRTRVALRRGLIGFGLLLAVLVLIWGCWMIWLQRFVIYTRDGAKLDMSMNPSLPVGQSAQKPAPLDIPVEFLDGDEDLGKDTELKQLKGYYVSTADLKDIPKLKEALKTLPKGTPVMFEVKSIGGNFYYSSTVAEFRSDALDITAMDELLEFIDKSGLYTIAYLPALRDYNYGLYHVPDGLPTTGGWLWMDSAGCYWLNPASQGTVTFLVNIITELRDLGFDEVVLYDYYFPDSTGYVYSGNKTEALENTAKTLVTTCATDRFAVSFVCDTEFTLPEGRCRMYLRDVAASRVEQIAQDCGLESPVTHLVFLTDIHDTRFDAYGVLRPIDSVY